MVRKAKARRSRKRTESESTQATESPTESKVLLLRTCKADLTSYGGFKWPESGLVEAPDWNPKPTCGYGLHGLLWGIGDVSLMNSESDAKWLVFEALASECVEIDTSKAKVKRGVVLFCGSRDDAANFLAARAPKDKAVAYAQVSAGDGGTATAGYGGTATAGYGGTATAGDGGTATAGDGGTATAGYGGTATAGTRGTATAGTRGILNLRWWDGNRYRIAIFYVGEDGIEPNVKYRCESGKAVKVNS